MPFTFITEYAFEVSSVCLPFRAGCADGCIYRTYGDNGIGTKVYPGRFWFDGYPWKTVANGVIKCGRHFLKIGNFRP